MKAGSKALVLGVVVIALIGSGACGGGGGGGGGGTPPSPAPTLTTVSPSSAAASGGMPITLTGTGFTGSGLQVHLGTHTAAVISVVSDTSLRCTCPVGTPGPAVDVVVTTDGGTATLPGAFTFLDGLVGSWHHVQLQAAAQVPPEGRGEWGFVTINGKGSVVGGQLRRNVNGALSGPDSPASFMYTIDANRRTTWTFGALTAFEGGLADDGRAYVLGSVDAAIAPTVVLGGRQDGPYGEADFSATYHMAFSFYDYALDKHAVLFGGVAFDGAGGASTTFGRNLGGDVLTGLTSTDTYAVDTDGTFTFTMLTVPFVGGAFQGGDAIFLGGAAQNNAVPGIAVLTRLISKGSDALLQGTYHWVRIQWDTVLPTLRWISATGTAVADGAGTLWIRDGTRNADGTIGGVQSYNATYAIAAHGGTTADFAGYACAGGVTADGRIAFFAGGTDQNDDPQLWVFVR